MPVLPPANRDPDRHPRALPVVDPAAVPVREWAVLVAGGLAFFFSLFDYYTVTRPVVAFSTSAWHGFFGWAAALLALAGAAAVALARFAPHVGEPALLRRFGAIAFALATVAVVVALVVNPFETRRITAHGGSAGHGFGYWASLTVIVVGTALSLVGLRETSEP